MKRLYSLIAVLMLAALMTGCANTVSRTADRMDPDWRGNVSTTDDGRVNGTNPSERRDITGRKPVRPTTRTNRTNTDAMGAGMDENRDR